MLDNLLQNDPLQKSLRFKSVELRLPFVAVEKKNTVSVFYGC